MRSIGFGVVRMANEENKHDEYNENQINESPSSEENQEQSCSHDLCVWETIVQPTCDSIGQEQRRCINCGELFGDIRSVDALGHRYVWKMITPPTCDESGTEQRQCVRCGKVDTNVEQPTREVKPAGHIPGTWEIIREETCEEDGEKRTHCKTCGVTLKEAIKAKHKPEDMWRIIVKPTTTSKGKRAKLCKVCGKHIEEGDIDMLPQKSDSTKASVVKSNRVYASHNFIVEFHIDGIDQPYKCSFCEISGFERSIEVIEWRTGLDKGLGKRKYFGTTHGHPLTFSKGVTHNKDLLEWMYYWLSDDMYTIEGKNVPFKVASKVHISLVGNSHSDVVRQWTLTNAWPIKISGPELNSMSNSIALERLDLIYGSISVDIPASSYKSNPFIKYVEKNEIAF